MGRPIGTYYSKYQESLDPSKITVPLEYAWWRTSYGMMKDERFDQLKDPIQEIECRGAFHYFSTGSPWKEQADFFLELSSGKGIKALAVDYEGGYNNLNATSAQNLKKMMDYLAAKRPGKNIVGYFGTFTYRDMIQPYVDIKMYPAWISRWYTLYNPQTTTPKYPKGSDRSDWAFWQHADGADGVPYGTPAGKKVCPDVFNGDLDQLKVFFKVNNQPEPEPEPEPVDCSGQVKAGQLEVLDQANAAINEIRENINGQG